MSRRNEGLNKVSNTKLKNPNHERADDTSFKRCNSMTDKRKMVHVTNPQTTAYGNYIEIPSHTHQYVPHSLSTTAVCLWTEKST